MRRLPTLTQLRHLVALADKGHFGQAAEACLVTQSSLSASLKELESGLGATLVERTRRSVMVTPLGEQVVARARALLRDAGELVDLVAAEDGPLSGALRLGVIPTVSPFLLPRVLPALRRAHGSLKLFIREDRTARLLDGLKAGELDLALLAYPYETERLESTVFADDPLWIAVAKDHPLAGRERVTRADLKGEELLLLEEGHCLRQHALGPMRAGAEAFQGSSLYTLVQMVDNGLGVTLLPKMAIDGGILKGTRVRALPLDGKDTSRQIGFTWRPSSPRKGEFELLSGFFRDELATPLTPSRRRIGK